MMRMFTHFSEGQVYASTFSSLFGHFVGPFSQVPSSKGFEHLEHQDSTQLRRFVERLAKVLDGQILSQKQLSAFVEWFARRGPTKKAGRGGDEDGDWEVGEATGDGEAIVSIDLQEDVGVKVR